MVERSYFPALIIGYIWLKVELANALVAFCKQQLLAWDIQSMHV